MKKYLAECVGTFVLTFLGCGAAVSLGCNTGVVAGTPAVIGTAIAFGLAVVAMAYTIGGINAKDCGMYMIFQTIGAILAACVLGVLAGFDCGLGANGLQTLNEIGTPGTVSVTTGLIAEIVLTMLFVLVVLGATSKTNGATNNLAGLAIGLSLILIHLVGIHYTGTSVNPARSIGPALLAGGDALNQLWIFIVGPFVGGALAACIWKVISMDKEAEK